MYMEYGKIPAYLCNVTTETEGEIDMMPTILSTILLFVTMFADPFFNPDGFSSGYEQIRTGEAGTPDDYSSPALQEFIGESDATADWTVVFYDDADCTNMFDPFTTFAGEMHSTDNINVVVLRDTETGPARYYHIPQTGSPVILEELGEVNMGDAQTLSDFLAYSKTNYPATRYLLCVYDHGGGFYGACVDLSAGNDLLYMDEFQSAITANGGVDIIAWLACCSMGAIESAYELRDCADVYVASEEGSFYNMWFGVLSYLRSVLDDSASLSSQDIGSLIVDKVAENFSGTTYDYATMSAIDEEQLEPLVAAFNELSAYMVENFTELVSVIEETRAEAWYMGGGYYEWPEIDFYDFLLLYQAAEDDPVVQNRITQVIDLFDAAIIAEAHGPTHEPRAHGLSIWFPDEEHERLEYYQNTNLDFNDDTQWGDFLALYFGWLLGVEDSSFSEDLSISPLSNPSSGVTELVYFSSATGSVSIGIHDLAGRRLNSFSRSDNSGSPSSLHWNGESDNGIPVPAGIYVITIQNNEGNRASCRVLII